MEQRTKVKPSKEDLLAHHVEPPVARRHVAAHAVNLRKVGIFFFLEFDERFEKTGPPLTTFGSVSGLMPRFSRRSWARLSARAQKWPATGVVCRPRARGKVGTRRTMATKAAAIFYGIKTPHTHPMCVESALSMQNSLSQAILFIIF